MRSQESPRDRIMSLRCIITGVTIALTLLGVRQAHTGERTGAA